MRALNIETCTGQGVPPAFAANELTLTTPPSGQPTTSSYDANGNLAVENAGGALTSYAWDPENRLTGVVYPTTAPDTMTYFADGRRASKVTAAAAETPVWDGQNVLLDGDANGVTQAHYTDFPGYWGGLVSQRRGVSSFFGFDLQGNVRILLNAAGDVTDQYIYKAFGEELFGSGSTVNPFRFGGVVGYYRDYAARLYVRARYLRPDLGRWLSRDPLRIALGDWNPYAYVRNDPSSYTDPSGLAMICCWLGLSFCCGKSSGGGTIDSVRDCVLECRKEFFEGPQEFGMCMAKCGGSDVCEKYLCAILPGLAPCLHGNPCEKDDPYPGTAMSWCQACCDLKQLCSGESSINLEGCYCDCTT